MHKDAGIDSDYIFVEADHCIPPVLFDIVLKLRTHLAVIVNSAQSVIDFTGWEDKTVLFAVCYKYFEKFVLCHSID